MNLNNYLVTQETNIEGNTLVYWKGVDLYCRGTLHFHRWLRWEYHLAINHNYLSSSADWQRTHCREYNNSAWERCWNFSLICFIQTQARKIQKFWRNIQTEVAMPCAEDVE